jgi:DNA-binding phage protein
MALTRDFRETVKARAERDPEFRNGLLTEALEAVVRGEFDVAKISLRDYINATEGFESVAEGVDKDPKSLMRMFGEKGNPNAKNLFGVTRYLQQKAGLKFTVVPVKAKAKKKVAKKKRELVN